MILIDRIVTLRSRSPCGERGLKCVRCKIQFYTEKSLPVRGAWIEIAAVDKAKTVFSRRSPCGERGLKYF